MEETEAKQTSVIDLNKMAQEKERQSLISAMTNYNGMGAIGGGLGQLYNSAKQKPEENLADCLGNLCQMLRQISHLDHPSISKIRNAIKETIKELL